LRSRRSFPIRQLPLGAQSGSFTSACVSRSLVYTPIVNRDPYKKNSTAKKNEK